MIDLNFLIFHEGSDKGHEIRKIRAVKSTKGMTYFTRL